MAQTTVIADAPPDEPILLRETGEGITTLTLNRPKARNSLSLALIAELKDGLEAVRQDVATSVVILKSTGHVFCAGHDLKEMTAHRAKDDRGRAHFEEVMSNCSAMMQAIVLSPKPVIAQVDGVATAAGCQLVASCDLAVVSSNSRFCTPGVNIGLFCSTPMVALTRNVSRKQAMEMLLLGDMIGADKALEIGLVNRVAPPEDVEREAVEMARAVAAKSPHVVAIGKEAFYRQAEMPLKDAYDYTAQVMVRNMLARDAEEGIGAFIEKRKPEWQGR